MRKHKLLIASLVIGVAAPVLAGPHEREERREDRREERREERHEEHREERREGFRGPREAPPALREERWENRKGYVYVRGRWDWRDGRYAWVPGTYERERVGYRWREPRWELRDGAYVRVDGSWAVRGPAMAPPAYRVERFEARPGFLWVRGRWAWNNGQYAWVGGHYERERAGYRWAEPRWEMRDGEYVEVGGSWEVVP